MTLASIARQKVVGHLHQQQRSVARFRDRVDEGAAGRGLVVDHLRVEGGLPGRAIGPFGDPDEPIAPQRRTGRTRERARPAPSGAHQPGISTVSMTWITPFEASMSVAVTVAELPAASVSTTFPPSAVAVSVAPLTVVSV